MCHAIVKRKIRNGFRHLSAGNYEAVLREFAPRVEFVFAGEHALGGNLGNIETIRLWFQRLFRIFPGLQFQVHDIVITGWPWHTVAATHFSVSSDFPDGRQYYNRGMQYVRLRWGRVVEDRIYEDTQKLVQELQHQDRRGMSEAGAQPISEQS